MNRGRTQDLKIIKQDSVKEIIKKLGKTLKFKNTTTQINELMYKIVSYSTTIIVHEIHELGIKPNFSRLV